MITTNFVWIDVSKKEIHIWDLKIKKYLKVKNDIKTIEVFFKNYDKESIVIYEPTSVYSKTVEMALNNVWQKHYQVHANKMKNLWKSLGYINKTDKLDCQMIAELSSLIEVRENQSWKSIFTRPNSNEVNQILHYLSQIEFYKKQKKRVKLEDEKLNNSPYKSETSKEANKTLIINFTKIINILEKEIQSVYNTSEEIKWKYEKLKTIPWVWTTASINMISFFSKLQHKWFTKKDSKKMISYSWLNPIQSSSWDKESSYLWKWDRKIRNAVYMTWIQRYKWIKKDINSNTSLWKFFLRMVKRFSSWSKKRWKSVACAFAKKILVIAWAMFRDNTEYNYI